MQFVFETMQFPQEGSQSKQAAFYKNVLLGQVFE